jgi:hypothetical protein
MGNILGLSFTEILKLSALFVFFIIIFIYLSTTYGIYVYKGNTLGSMDSRPIFPTQGEISLCLAKDTFYPSHNNKCKQFSKPE